MRPKSIFVIVVVNTGGAFLTLIFWGIILIRVFVPDAPPSGMDTSDLAATFGFMVSDLTWAVFLLAASVIGLLRQRAWGWLAAQMVNILWLYSMSVIWCRDMYAGRISPGAILFLPFVPFSLWAIPALWKTRRLFWYS